MASRFLSTLPDAPAVLRRMSLRAPFATGRAAPDLHSVTPSEALGGLLGLAGTLRMDDHLTSPPGARGAAQSPRAGAAASQADAIARYVGDKAAAIRLEAITTLAMPHTGPHAVPGADALAQALVSAGALGTRQRRRWEKAGKALAPKYARPFGAAVAQARKKIGWMRADVLEMLRRGPRNEALVAFDAVLAASTESGVQRALARAEESLAAYFVEAMVGAGKRLDPTAPPSDVGIWLERGGWIEVFLLQQGDLALALIDREIDVVRALVDGAVASSSVEGQAS